MKILRLDVKGIRGLPDRTFDFTDPRTGAPLGVVLIAGGSGAGKTSLLDAIAAAKEATGSYGGPLDPRRLARGGARDARMAATWLLSATEREQAQLAKAEQTVVWALGTGATRAEVEPGLRRVFAHHSRAPEHGKLEYFPADRSILGSAHPAFRRVGRDGEARLRATRAPDKYAYLLDALREPALEQARRAAQVVTEQGVLFRAAMASPLDAYERAIAAMLPDLRLSGVALTDDAGPRFVRRSREVLAFDELSHGEQQAVLFALAFVYLGLHDSLVLIDEPELHIHASDRVRFLHALVGLGKDNQILAATGAVELTAAASPGQILDLSRAPVPSVRAAE